MIWEIRQTLIKEFKENGLALLLQAPNTISNSAIVLNEATPFVDTSVDRFGIDFNTNWEILATTAPRGEYLQELQNLDEITGEILATLNNISSVYSPTCLGYETIEIAGQKYQVARLSFSLAWSL